MNPLPCGSIRKKTRRRFGPVFSLGTSGIDFNAAAPANPPHTFQVTLSYDGTNLTEMLTDLTTSSTFSHAYPVNIAQVVGQGTAYVGFTAGTGGATSVQDILTWTGNFNGTQISHGAGFAAHTDLQANGNTAFSTVTVARLTDGGGGKAGSLFTTAPVPISVFTTTFTFQMRPGSNPIADGLTFTIQNDPRGAAALGLGGGALGYGRMPGDTNPPAITHSVAIKFDAYKPSGNHSSTGLYVNGTFPDNSPPAPNVFVDLMGSGIDFNAAAQANSPHSFQVTLAYDGINLNETIKDLTTNVTFSHAYTVNIAQIVGQTTAYVGFTAGTGAFTSTQDILTWTGNFAGSIPAPANLNVNRSPAPLNEGSPLTLAGSFTDVVAGQAHTVVITWGDGSSFRRIPLAPGVFSFSTTHTYLEEGTYDIHVTVRTDGGDSVTTSLLGVPVGDPAVAATGGFTFLALAGVATPLQTVATFIDPGPEALTDYTATINLGDTSTSSGTISDSNDVFIVQGSHTYAQAGTPTIAVTLRHDMTANVLATSTAQVSWPHFLVSGFPSPSVAGTPFIVTVTAQDPYGNTATGFRGTVHFSSTDPQATVPSDYAFTAADSGVHTFSGVVLRSAGGQTLTAASGPIGAVTEFAIPTANSAPAGITAGPDGNLWSTEYSWC